MTLTFKNSIRLLHVMVTGAAMLIALSPITPAYADGQAKFPSVICFNQAKEKVRFWYAADLCSGASNAQKPIECFEKALRVLPWHLSVKLCKGANDLESLKCYAVAKELLPDVSAVELCASGSQKALECYKTYRTRLNVKLVFKLCSGQ